jgi:class 3 adenylate cyclase
VIPPVSYARSGDLRIAYQVTGEGKVDLVLTPGTFSNLDLDWDWPANKRFFDELGAFARLIRLDKRGTGLSDRPIGVPTLEERMDDIRAVMDAIGSEKAALFGVSEGGSMAALFAATYPERTRALLLWGVQARWVQSSDYSWGVRPEELDAMLAELQENGLTREYVMGFGVGLGEDADPAYVDWLVRYGRSAVSPGALVALERMNALIDIRDILPTIRVPTLVMNRRLDPLANVDAAAQIATSIPGAKFKTFDGSTHPPYSYEPEKVVAAVEEFLTGSPAPPRIDRMLATVLVTDVVGSTARASQMGDALWADLLSRHLSLSDRAVAAHGGEVVNHAGDSLTAAFDGPARAIRCALAVREQAEELGLELRAGLHAGEVERRAGGLEGIAVHIAARIAAMAGPRQVWASGTVRDLVAGSGLEFRPRGSHDLKGVPEPRALYEVAG